MSNQSNCLRISAQGVIDTNIPRKMSLSKFGLRIEWTWNGGFRRIYHIIFFTDDWYNHFFKRLKWQFCATPSYWWHQFGGGKFSMGKKDALAFTPSMIDYASDIAYVMYFPHEPRLNTLIRLFKWRDIDTNPHAWTSPFESIECE